VTVRLVEPGPDWLDAYAAALARGWSPNTTRDVSGEHLAAIRADGPAFLRDLLDPNGTVTLADGAVVPKLPAYLFWIVDRDFCGSINFRFQPGTEALPPYCSGHIGYSIVPWRQRRGHATAALRQILPLCRREGFARVSITCDEDNLGSIKVIEANGGVLAGTHPDALEPGLIKRLYWVRTPEAPRTS
jgi:predicted acetyltransferase